MGPAAAEQPVEHRAAMTPAQMNELIEQHIAAESVGDWLDSAAIVAQLTA